MSITLTNHLIECIPYQTDMVEEEIRSPTNEVYQWHINDECLELANSKNKNGMRCAVQIISSTVRVHNLILNVK